MNVITNMIEIYKANPTQEYYAKIHRCLDEYYNAQSQYIDNKLNDVRNTFNDSLSKDRITKHFCNRQLRLYEDVCNEQREQLRQDVQKLRNLLNSI